MTVISVHVCVHTCMCDGEKERRRVIHKLVANLASSHLRRLIELVCCMLHTICMISRPHVCDEVTELQSHCREIHKLVVNFPLDSIRTSGL